MRCTVLGCIVLGNALRRANLTTGHLRDLLLVIGWDIIIWIILVCSQLTSHSETGTNSLGLLDGLFLSLKSLATFAGLLVLGSNSLNGGVLHAEDLNRIEETQHTEKKVSLNNLSDDVAGKDAGGKIIVDKHLLQHLLGFSVGTAILGSLGAPLAKTLLILGVERLNLELHVVSKATKLSIGTLVQLLHSQFEEVHAKRITHAHRPDVVDNIRKELVADDTNVVLVLLRKSTRTTLVSSATSSLRMLSTTSGLCACVILFACTSSN